jgi:hypothetical protein
MGALQFGTGWIGVPADHSWWRRASLPVSPNQISGTEAATTAPPGGLHDQS